MQRYFAKEKVNDNLILYDSDINHIKKVMRNQIGDEIEVIYDKKVHICTITNMSPLTISVSKIITEDRNYDINFTVAIALVSEQKFDLILQKLTELGVSTIIPLKTERSIVKLDKNKESKKIERWQMICKEASEQSKRIDIPKVTNIMTLADLTNMTADLKLLCSLSKDTKPLSYYMQEEHKSIIFAIGPEGGFSDKEETYLVQNNYQRTSLGKRVMRVETAAFYVASIINYTYKG